MKTIIAGGRNITDLKLVEEAAAACGWPITEVVCGTARGADTLGEEWAIAHSVPVKRMPADWDHLGKRAGFLRNQAMATYAEALIIVWDGVSKGSAHMLAIALAMKLPVYEKLVPYTEVSDEFH